MSSRNRPGWYKKLTNKHIRDERDEPVIEASGEGSRSPTVIRTLTECKQDEE